MLRYGITIIISMLIGGLIVYKTTTHYLSRGYSSIVIQMNDADYTTKTKWEEEWRKKHG